MCTTKESKISNMEDDQANSLELPDAIQVLDDLRQTCGEIRQLINTQYPPALIGYFWSMMFLALMGKSQKSESNELAPATADESNLIFAMEYIHAVIASDGISIGEFANVEEDVANRILELSTTALSKCFLYGMVQSKNEGDQPNFENQKLSFEILSNWVMIRGKRYQVLEEEFFAYSLATHDDILLKLYGIDSAKIALEIQKITDSTRMGLARGASAMTELMDETNLKTEKTGLGMAEAFQLMADENPEIADKARNAINDMFLGGSFNLSRHTELPDLLLQDLAFSPGEDNSFLSGSKFAGTPFKTLPARIKPLVKINDDYYCTEPNFVRDAAYRAIQRAIVKRQPSYQESWNTKQKELSENSFTAIMSEHLKGAEVFGEVFYPIGNGNWAETDCVILCDDILISIECKAGVEALQPPAENMQGHLDNVERLLLSAYRQTKRFVDYLYSDSNTPLFSKKVKGGHQEIGRINAKNLRHIFPIGLTLESFTPFSSTIKELEEVKPIAGKHDFFALSVDDLIAMKYILSGTGEFLHYLEVRQALAAMKNVMLFDEMDHLGAYMSNNRVDQTVKEQFIDGERADFVYLDGFDQDIIAPFFQGIDQSDKKPPQQVYPDQMRQLFLALERCRMPGWLAGDAFLRNMGSNARNDFAKNFDRTLPILAEKPFTFFATGGGIPAVFCLTRADGVDRSIVSKKKAEAMCLAFNESQMELFEISISQDKRISIATSKNVNRPSVISADYPEILQDANRLKGKIEELR